MRCSLSSSTRKRPSGSISSIWPSMTKSSSFATRSGLLEIHGRLFAAPIRLQFIAEALVALERRHAGPFNGGNVDEAVAGAIFIRNEAIALVGVEEFYGTNRHECFLSRNLFPAGQRVQQEPGSVEGKDQLRSEEHKSELQSLMRTSSAVFCLKKKNTQ